MDQPDAVDALRRLGGVATFGELKGLVTHDQLTRAVAAGRVHKPRFNRYVLVDVAAHRRAAATTGGVISHLSAAEHYGWKLKFVPTRPCITLPRSAHKPVGDYELHWADLSEKELHRHVTSRARTVIDCARAYDFDVALAVADSALREGILDQDDLLLAAAASPRTGRRRALAVAEAATGLRANPFESCLAAILMKVAGLDAQPQVEIDGVGRVDFLGRPLGIVVEAESLEFHGTRTALERDTKRYTACARLGLVVVRFTWDQVMFWPEEVLTVMEEVVRWRTMQAVGGHGLAC